MLIINFPASLHTPEKAARIAEAIKQDDPNCTYNVVNDPKGTGLCYIEVFDEQGKFVGKL